MIFVVLEAFCYTNRQNIASLEVSIAKVLSAKMMSELNLILKKILQTYRWLSIWVFYRTNGIFSRYFEFIFLIFFFIQIHSIIF